MKKHEIIFSLIKAPLDAIIIFFAFFLARNLREINDFIPGIQLEKHILTNEYLIYFALFWSILYISIFSIHKLYSLKINSSKIKEFLDIILYSIYFFLFYSVFIYFWKWFFYQVEIPRLVIIFTTIIWAIWVIFQRIILNKIQNILLNKKILKKRKIILITNKSEAEIKHILKDISQASIYELVWYINKNKLDSKLKYLWDLDELLKILQKREIDEILLIDNIFDNNQLYKIWDFSRIYWINYRYLANSFDINKINTEVSLINKIPVIEIRNTSITPYSRVLKRSFDLICSSILIILLFPFFIIIWLLIKLEDSGGPIIYKNLRIWQSWRKFNLYKFRYLRWKYCIKESYWIENKNDEALEFEKKLIEKNSTRKWPLYKIKNDPRKTKIWNFIEKYSIDELPQLFNVFLWNMSLVWPRPHQPREVEKYEIYQMRVLTIKPWITWLAQVNGRDNNSFEKEVNLDIFYIENFSFLLDLKIFLKTLNIVINRK